MKRLPVLLAGLAITLCVPGAVVTSLVQWTSWADLPFGVMFCLLGIASAVTGAAVASRLPRNPVGWLILALGLGVGLLLAAGAYAEVGVLTSTGPLPTQAVAAWVGDVLSIPVFFGATGLLLLLFPTGRPLSPAWRWFTWAFAATVATATLSYGLIPGEIGPGVENPFGLPGDAGRAAEAVAVVTDWLALPAMLVCAVALVVRLRRSEGVQRQQLKWFTYAAAVAGVGLGATILTRGLVADLAFFVGMAGVLMLPVSAGIAILRHRLYDIDVVIKRTLVYGSLTAALLATYLVLVLTLQPLLRPLTGESSLAVAASTLAVAALFRPLRSAIQRGVDRRFFRARYDAARTLGEFADRLRNELDLDSLGHDLRTVVHDTMQPEHVSLWLRRAEP
jgi:hypothetical protein